MPSPRKPVPVVWLGLLFAVTLWAVEEEAAPVQPPDAGPAQPEGGLVDVTPDGALRMGGKAWPPVQAGQQRARDKAPRCVPEYAVVANGHCWLELKQRPPHCPPKTYQHDGACLAPVAERTRPATSVQP